MAPVDDGLQPPRVRLEVQKTPGNPAWFCAGVYGRRPRSGPATSMTSFSSHCCGLPLLRPFAAPAQSGLAMTKSATRCRPPSVSVQKLLRERDGGTEEAHRGV
jgi:hypothetical protein